MERDRMFRVIVLGGLSLVGPTACASTVGTGDASDAQDTAPDFPSELPVFVDVPNVDTGSDAMDVPPDFPAELPVFVDSGADADAGADTGFPLECAAGQTACGGVCVDTQTDPNNCGVCGHPCGPSGVCNSGICQPLPGDGGSGG